MRRNSIWDSDDTPPADQTKIKPNPTKSNQIKVNQTTLPSLQPTADGER
jgi:hypothetical protein